MAREVVLVTGGAGYIGSHTLKALYRDGYWPVSIDTLARGHAEAVRYGELYVGDVADRDLISALCNKFNPVGCIHFAAFAYVGESTDHPMRYYVNNVGNGIKFVENILSCGVNKIVSSSSCATYGSADVLPIPETTIQSPVNPYGNSKLVMEFLLKDLAVAGELSSVVFRYFNAAGADPDGELGESHDPEPHVIPRILSSAQTGRPFQVYGTDYPTPDGTAIRDYVHVSDLADAHVLALRYLLDGGSSDVFNVGTGVGYSVRELVAEGRKVTGRSIDIDELPRRPGDPSELVADVQKIRRVLGHKTSRSSLANIMGTAWRWACRSA